MKHFTLTSLFILSLFLPRLSAQENKSYEKYGNTINLGLGLGYYNYVGYNTPVLHFNYEIDLDKNLTIAPFISAYSYHQSYYWGNPSHDYRYYNYTETVIPVGAKVSYYFDQLLKANPKWDFYLAGSLGFVIRRTTWESSYYGDTQVRHGGGYLYLDGHIGTEYHMNNSFGIFLDLSTGMSTIGLAIHL